MSSELKNKLRELLTESSAFNINDILAHVDPENSRLLFTENTLTFTTENAPRKILRQAERSFKESGINTLCFAKGVVHLRQSSKELNSPLILFPITTRRDNVRGTIELRIDSENGFINPFVVHHLKRNLDLDITETVFENDLFESSISLLLEKGFKIQSDVTIIGNFHHHRYSVIKELEELIAASEASDALFQLMGGESAVSGTVNIPKNNLFAADTDHERVFDSIKNENAVIQGPPGTGKSQVLSNVIGKMLYSEQSTMVVSEKYSALSVIVKKLSLHQLDKLCFIANADNLSHSFLQSLKTTWDYFDDFAPSHEVNLRLSEQVEDQLQITLDILSIPDLIGGVSYHEFCEISKGYSMNHPYFSTVPEISELQLNREIIEFSFSENIHNSLGRLKPSTFQKDQMLSFDRQINQWIDSQLILSKYFAFETWNDVQVAMKNAANCQIFENDLFKQYRSILRPNSKGQKRFLSLRKKYLQLKSKIVENQSDWKIEPSLVATTALINDIRDGGYFVKRNAKRSWRKLSDLPFSGAESILVNHMDQLKIKEDLSQINFNFCDLGIENPSEMISVLHQSLHHYTTEAWEVYERISSDRRGKITEAHAKIHEFWSSCRKYLRLSPEDKLSPIFDDLSTHLSTLVSKREQLSILSAQALENFYECASFEMYQSRIFASHLTRFNERFPKLSNFDFTTLVSSIQEILQLQKQEERLFAKDIEKGIHAKFTAYHELLNTPARKLNEADKLLKRKLKKGKALLVKEFAKTRSHPSLRKLFESDARLWIQLLKPIWLSNPSQVAKCFPMEVGLFDTVVFDEASQIPLQHSVGSVQRAKRIIIAGDDQQMSPSNYFTTGDSTPIDLLHQANYHLTKIGLKHHYRSIHSQLIEFSNVHFYEGQLCNYPSPPNGKAVTHYFVEKATFEDRKNSIEATVVAKHIEKSLETKKSIGVAAFSEEQLTCIWEALSLEAQSRLERQWEQNIGFFKAVENIQGDECDELIISFGYAPNKEGVFHMRFGPMGTANGRKRLNVLLTRAKESIHFFCSIHSSDFKLSENESINLLRKWVQFSEKSAQVKEIKFPFDLKPSIEGKTLTFSRIQDTLSNVQELVTLHSLLTERGWIVNYS